MIITIVSQHGRPNARSYNTIIAQCAPVSATTYTHLVTQKDNVQLNGAQKFNTDSPPKYIHFSDR